MKERLIIKNFGPIKSVDLDLRKINVLIGEQATGKSTIAKVLSVCRYFSYIVNFQVSKEEFANFNINQQFADGLMKWGIIEYYSSKPESYIFYENSSYKFEVKIEKNWTFSDHDEFDFKSKITPCSQEFKVLLEEFEDLRSNSIEAFVPDIEFELYNPNWTPNENFYRLNVKKVMDNPFFIPTERGYQTLDYGKGSLVADALVDELVKANKIAREFKKENIEPLGLSYKNEGGIAYVKKEKDENYHTLQNGASGYQSLIPLVLSVKYFNQIKKRKRTFIIEEPEQNLFPKAQKKLVEYFVQSVNEFDNQFLLPTHSPYILSSLENLMYAFKLGNTENGKYEEKVSSIIDKKHWLNHKDVSAYYLDGEKAVDLMQREESLINTEYIDGISEIINGDFDNLLALDVAIEKGEA